MTSRSDMQEYPQHFEIDGRSVGAGHPVYVIAEAGVAHFGDESKAYRLVDLAKSAGADAVKFQIFDVSALISKSLPDWQQRLASRQLPYDAFARIQSYCREVGISFLATAHDEPSLEYLASLDVPAYKVGSGEVGNWPFLARVAAIGKPVIFSTGMYQIDQIEEALRAIQDTGNRRIAILHCVTRYPTPPEEASLGNIATIRDRFNAITGYSDHTRGFHFPLAAVALGARIIEKHITLDFDVPNAQDWKVSCGPENFGDFIQQLREIEVGLTARHWGPTEGEKESLLWAGKSLVATCCIPSGNVIQASDLVAKRPGSGIPPSRTNDVVGRITRVSIEQDQVITWEDLI